MMDSLDAPDTLRAPFLGFLAGAVLFGVTALQAYQYFLNYGNDSRGRKLTIITVCLFDSLHFAFSSVMIYASLTSTSRFENATVVWSMKAMATAKALLMILIQSFYLHLIWTLADNMFIQRTLSRAIKGFSVLTFVYALGVGSVFLAYLAQIVNISSFSVSFENVIYIAYASTVAIDSGIAAIMSVVLHKSNSKWPSGKGTGVVNYLVVFFVGSGLLTAISAIITIVLYVCNPTSVLYLAIEFSVPRIYANAILALFNAKSRLKGKMDGSVDLRMPSAIVFGESPDFLQEPKEPPENHQGVCE